MSISVNRRTVAIMVTYRRQFLLTQCIQAILELTVSCDVLVMDNHSGNKTQKMVAGIDSHRVFYCDKGVNLGGAGALAMECAGL